MSSVTQTKQSLASIAARLHGRAETRSLAKEIDAARESLSVIDNAVANLQRECEASLEALLQSETVVRGSLAAVEGALRANVSTAYLLRVVPGGFSAPTFTERLAALQRLLFAVEGVSFSWGLGAPAARLRQSIFALEDNRKRREFLLRARANALQRRAQALSQSRQLLQRLVLQSKLLFPVVPVYAEIEDRFFPRAA